MNQNLTEIVFILDRSGSMGGLENDTIGGFNGFVKKQAESGQTSLTTVLFDDKYEILHNGIDAGKVVLTSDEYFTRSSTALLDAVGKLGIKVSRSFCFAASSVGINSMYTEVDCLCKTIRNDKPKQLKKVKA